VPISSEKLVPLSSEIYTLEGSGDGTWDWKISTNAVVLSERYRAMLGYHCDELLAADLGGASRATKCPAAGEDSSVLRSFPYECSLLFSRL
jgi:hypothetical protein